MILTIDIGNTAISFKFESSKTSYNIILEITGCQSEQECTDFIQGFLASKNIDPKYVTDIAICSVVDSIKVFILKSITKIFDANIKCLTYNSQNLIKIKTNTPDKLGADMIATAIGAIDFFDSAVCIVDCGTATTTSLINKDKAFISYNIMPGIKVQFQSLAQATFKLPDVKPKFSKDILGKNTKDAILSGVLRGHGNAINKFISNINTSFPNLHVILTGGFNTYVRDYLDFEHIVVSDLIHIGLAK